jgi:hypothetical protein
VFESVEAFESFKGAGKLLVSLGGARTFKGGFVAFGTFGILTSISISTYSCSEGESGSTGARFLPLFNGS